MKPVREIQGGLDRLRKLFPGAGAYRRHPINDREDKAETTHKVAVNTMNIDVKKKIIAICLFAAMFFWLLDALLDFAYKHQNKTFIQCLFYDAPLHDLFERILVSAVTISLGFILSTYIGKVQRIHMRYQHLFHSVNDAIFILSADDRLANQYRIIDANEFAISMVRYKINELFNMSFIDLLPSTAVSEFSSQVDIFGQNDYVLLETEMLRKDGSKLFAQISISHGDVSGDSNILLIARDITAKKRDEQSLLQSEKELRILASRLLNAQEAGRQRISVGLHDELGQALMHLKFKLSSVAKQCRKNAPLSPDYCAGLLPHVDEIIEYVRRLSRELSPSVLEEIGLISSIEYLLEQFGDHYNMRCSSIELDQIDHIFPFDTQLNIFRIFQECLANAARHAQAAAVSVTAKKLCDHVFFKVEDDGKGFAVKQGAPFNGAQRGMGISAMQQRVRMAGGSFEICSTEGVGTSVSFTIPLAKD